MTATPPISTMSNLTGIALVMSRIIFKVSSIDFIFGDPFTPRLQGDELKKEIMHCPQTLHRGALEKGPLFFILENIHDGSLHENRLSNIDVIYKAILRICQAAENSLGIWPQNEG
jgi:hypothetical protein